MTALLDAGRVVSHPFVIGEIALGHLEQRALVLQSLTELPQAVVATENEVIALIDAHELYGLGIGYIDAHLLAAVRLTAGCSLWTRDKRLRPVASGFGLSA